MSNLVTDLISGLAWLPFVAEFAVKATLVLLLTAAAAVALRRYSAAVRHMVWCVGLASVLALPLFSVLVPAWDIPVLPPSATTSTATGSSAYEAAVESVATGVVSSTVPIRQLETIRSEGAAPTESGWYIRAITGVMLAGVMIGLLWFIAGFWGAARLGRVAQVVRDPKWLTIAQEMSGRLGLRRPVLLLQSGGTVMPATWGLVWPSVVLPASADAWSTERRRAVLAHELAHVKRFDCLTQALAHIACVLFWWHPAVWYAAGRLRVERERACDDLVLLAGTRGSDYAMHLLDIARAYRVQWIAGAALVSMAKPSQLESRLLSVLDDARPRNMPSIRSALLSVLVGVGLVAPLAAMRPIERAAGTDQVEDLATLPATVPVVQASHPASRAIFMTPHEGVARGQARLTGSGMELDFAPGQLGVHADTPIVGEYANTAGGNGGLTIDELIERRIHGVTPEFIREMAAVGYGDLSHQQLVPFRIHGVTAEFVRELEALGYRGLSPEQLVQMRVHDVSPGFIRQMREIGVGELSPEMLVRLRISGVDRDLIESYQRVVTPNR